jgi:hypothetical protein
MARQTVRPHLAASTPFFEHITKRWCARSRVRYRGLAGSARDLQFVVAAMNMKRGWRSCSETERSNPADPAAGAPRTIEQTPSATRRAHLFSHHRLGSTKATKPSKNLDCEELSLRGMADQPCTASP